MIRLFFCFFLFSPVASALAIKHGVWQADSRVEINGISLPPSQEQECISASEAKDIKKTIVKELDKKGCASTKWIVKGKRVEVSLKCTKSGLNAKGHLQGVVTAKSYDLTGEAEGTYERIPSQASFILKGKWIKSCVK